MKKTNDSTECQPNHTQVARLRLKRPLILFSARSWFNLLLLLFLLEERVTKAIRRLHTWSVAHKVDRNLKKGAAQIQEAWHGKSKAKHTLCSI